MTINLYLYDLPDELLLDSSNGIAIDTEAMGLKNHRDRLCLVQLSTGDGQYHLVHFPKPDFTKAKNLKKILQDDGVLKIFHYARFDLAIMMHYLNTEIRNVYCTKIASRMARTFTSKHSLKDLCKDFLQTELPKQEQTSDWGAEELTEDQKKYAANDVRYLHAIKNKLDAMLIREGRTETVQACFDFLPHRARLDLLAGECFDIFSHNTDDNC